ncbi:MAG: hypothetical protein AAB388_04210 [Patescibacteria group bacterium]
MSDETSVAKKPKRAPRRPSATRVRKITAEQPAVRESEVETLPRESGRKAPTPMARERASSRRQRNHIVVAIIVFLLGVGASAAVGVTDEGRIDVIKAIEERNERIRANTPDARDSGTPTDIVVPVQNTNRGPALVPLPDEQLPLRETNSSSTASSTTRTDEVASSTEATTTTSTDVEPVFVTDPFEPVVEPTN